MKALVYKDLLAVWKYCRTYLLMCALFLIGSVFIAEYSYLPHFLRSLSQSSPWRSLS